MPDTRRIVEEVWSGRGARARTIRALLAPAEALYRIAVMGRGKLYDWRILSATEFSVPVLSVGNLSVGGTGKTPISAWLAQRLTGRGITPAIVLRGYGGDEIVVHQRLNPGIPVIASPDRVRGIREAIAQGADVVILDDAFQRRRARRDVDILLVNADAWTGRARLLPAGPWREPLRAARRATLVVITRKTADKSVVADVTRALANAAPRVPVAAGHPRAGGAESTSPRQSMPLPARDGGGLTAIAAIA